MFFDPELTVNVLYSKPVHVVHTTVRLDGKEFLDFKDVEIAEFPPKLGRGSLKMKKGVHVIEVSDATYSLEKKEEFSLQKRSWIDVIIHDDSISVHLLDREPRYK